MAIPGQDRIDATVSLDLAFSGERVTIDRKSRPKTKRRRTVKLPRRNSPQPARQTGASVASLKKKNALLTRELSGASRELSESLEPEKATSQVLGIISSSPTELEPVFETILANATRLCEASHGTLWLWEGDVFRRAAVHGAVRTVFEAERWREGFRPAPGGPLGRAASTAFELTTGYLLLQDDYTALVKADEVERVLAEVDPDRGDDPGCLLRCAHRMLLEPCFTPPSHSPAD